MPKLKKSRKSQDISDQKVNISNQEVIDITNNLLAEYYEENEYQAYIKNDQIFVNLNNEIYELSDLFHIVPILKIKIQRAINNLIKLKNTSALYDLYKNKYNTLQKVSLKYQNNNFDIMEDNEGVEYVMDSSIKNIWKNNNTNYVWVTGYKMFKNKISLKCNRKYFKFVEQLIRLYITEIDNVNIWIKSIFRISETQTYVILDFNRKIISNPKQICIGIGSNLHELYKVLPEKICFYEYFDDPILMMDELISNQSNFSYRLESSQFTIHQINHKLHNNNNSNFQKNNKLDINMNKSNFILIKQAIRYFFPTYKVVFENITHEH